MVTIHIEHEDKEFVVSIKTQIKLITLLDQQQLNIEEFIIKRDKEVLTEDDLVQPDDTLVLMKVWSGG